jgi:hypothetical protein
MQGKWLNDKVTLGKVHDKEIKAPLNAFNAGITHRLLKGLDLRINVYKQPKFQRCHKSA